ncbi:hypothetical protein [Alistipes timonensis]
MKTMSFEQMDKVQGGGGAGAACGWTMLGMMGAFALAVAVPGIGTAASLGFMSMFGAHMVACGS